MEIYLKKMFCWKTEGDFWETCGFFLKKVFLGRTVFKKFCRTILAKRKFGMTTVTKYIHRS